MTQSLTQAALFLINIVFTFFINMVFLRFFLQWVKADFYNPLCQFVIKITNFALLPLRRIIPGFLGLDWAAIVLVILVQALELALISLLTGPTPGALFPILILTHLLSTLLVLYFMIILGWVLFNFSSNAYRNPIYIALSQLCEPILRPIRRMIPALGGFDLSPLIALIVIQVILIFLRPWS
jgi:YggT family protein